MSSVFNLAGWICFALAAKNFLGIGAAPEEIGTAFIGEILGDIFPIPDVKTILLAGGAVLLGFLAGKTSRDQPSKGTIVMICGIVCIALTFTPLSKISVFSTMMSYQSEQRAADGYETIPEGDYTLYAFLGSKNSKPSDVDVMRYIMEGYDGHAEDSYKTYKITGWLYQGSGENLTPKFWPDVEVIFRLVDEEGNDILSDGEPVLLRFEYSQETMSVREQNAAVPEGTGSFQTNTVKASGLSGTPYGFRVESVKKGYYIDINDGTKHDSPIYQ